MDDPQYVHAGWMIEGDDLTEVLECPLSGCLILRGREAAHTLMHQKKADLIG